MPVRGQRLLTRFSRFHALQTLLSACRVFFIVSIFFCQLYLDGLHGSSLTECFIVAHGCFLCQLNLDENLDVFTFSQSVLLSHTDSTDFTDRRGALASVATTEGLSSQRSMLSHSRTCFARAGLHRGVIWHAESADFRRSALALLVLATPPLFIEGVPRRGGGVPNEVRSRNTLQT